MGSTVLILTALPKERQAVTAHLEGHRHGVEGGLGTVHEGTFQGRWRILVLETGKGQNNATLVAEKALQRFQPDLFLFVGVAGGRKDLKLGDVLIPDRIYNVEPGKDTAAGFQARPHALTPDFELLQQAKYLGEFSPWRERIRYRQQPSIPPNPACLVAPLASGEVVVAASASDTDRRIDHHYNDAAAIGMEDYGVLLPIHQGRRQVPALVLRGISDLLEGKGESDGQGWQEIAAAHAAALAFEILHHVSLPAGKPPEEERGKPRHNLPARNPDFLGRDRLLRQLWQGLDGGRPLLIQAVAGMGGVGKTQTALEFAWRHEAEFSFLWWLRAETETTLVEDLLALGRALGIDYPAREALTALRERLAAEKDPWLLIFDNAEEPELVRRYLPSSPGCRALVTSRRRQWPRWAQGWDVALFTPQEAVAFLRKRTGRKAGGAARLAEILGHLPLALEQAAAYCLETGASFDDYTRLFQQYRLEVLKNSPAPEDHPDTVAATWGISFRKLREESPAGAELMTLFAFFAPDPIPVDLLAEPLTALAGGELALEKAFAAINRFSLARREGNDLTIHRLVQEAAKPLGEEKTWLQRGAAMVKGVFRFVAADLATWDPVRRLLPHALLLAKGVKESAPGSAARFWNEAGLYHQYWGRFAEAKDCLLLSLQAIEQESGPDHPEAATAHNNLGDLLQDLGKFSEARAHLERALAINTKHLGPDHPDVAKNHSNLGLLLRNLGEFTEARAHLEQALAISTKHFGLDHPNVAIRHNNLGTLLRNLGEFTEARTHLERALAINTKHRVPDHPSVATGHNNLGMLLLDLKEFTAARTHLERALAICRRTLGEDHHNTQQVLRNLQALPPPEPPP